MAKLHTPLCDRLGIRLPIIQAPMAGGPTTPELVSAVSEAGALGSFGLPIPSPRPCSATWKRCEHTLTRRSTSTCSPRRNPEPSRRATQRDAIDAVAGYYAELGLPAPEPVRAPYAPDLEAQFALAEAGAARRAHLPPGRHAARARAALPEPGHQGRRRARPASPRPSSSKRPGVDFIIAQGAEAGGHRGTHLRNPVRFHDRHLRAGAARSCAG